MEIRNKTDLEADIAALMAEPLVQKLGAEKILSMAEKLGFGTSVSLADNLETAAGSLSNAQALKNARALALFSFGQGETTVSPLNLAAAVNAIAADGIYMTPRLVYSTVDTNLSVQETEENTGEKVMEPTTAARLRAYMESTARFGTARVGAPQNCVSGIKTGTAQTGVYDENGEEIENYWYAGYICNAQEEPLYTLVVLEETAGEMHVPQAFRKIGEALARRRHAACARKGDQRQQPLWPAKSILHFTVCKWGQVVLPSSRAERCRKTRQRRHGLRGRRAHLHGARSFICAKDSGLCNYAVTSVRL